MLDFNNTEVAFAHRSDKELKKAHFVFKIIAMPWLNAIGTRLTRFALNVGLPIKPLVKYAVFDHFCGGETIEGCRERIAELYRYKVGTILDYSVEGDQNEAAFEACLAQLLEGLKLAQKEAAIPFCVVKFTGLIPFNLLEKKSALHPLTPEEQIVFERGKSRAFQIAEAAIKADTPFMIDAEESWIQEAIDNIVLEMMMQFNREKVYIYNTAQMYRHDRFNYIKALHKKALQDGFKIGLKVVRGAYMEKERERAKAKGYPSPIQADKAATDRDYNHAIEYILKDIDNIALCCGTHNEASSLLLTNLIKVYNLSPNHPHIHFSQLLGMSDHISYNLSQAGYNVAKYVPYVPIKDVMPYLIRRADENTSVAGQTGRELSLLTKELERRKKA